MKSYEGVFVFPPESAPEARKSQLKSLDELISKFGGTIQQKQEWGKRPMGYAIKKFSEGYYVICDYQMETSKAPEFRKGLELQDELLKFMVTSRNVKAEKRIAQRVAASAKSKPAAPQTPAPVPH